MSPAPPSSWPRRLRPALLAFAAASALLLLRQLYTSGAPLWRFKPPFVYQLAGLAALCGAAAIALGGPRRRAPLVAAALALAVYLGNDRRLVSGDTLPATYVPYAVVRHGTLSLDEVYSGPLPYWIVESRGRLWSRYPVVAGLLALPVYLPAALGPGRPGALPHAEKLSAALMAAASVGLVLAALLAVGAPAWLAALGTALYAFASPALSTYSQALWQHAPGSLGVALAAWAAARATSDDRFHAVAGLGAGLAAAARPTNALVLAAFGARAAARGRPGLARFAAGAVPPLALTALYDTVAFGAPWATGYGAAAASFDHPFWSGLRDVLLSPTRGLLTFVPWAAFGLAGLALGARRDGLHRAMLAAALGVVLAYAPWRMWWGGWCYGPRMVSDVTPLLAIGLAPLAAIPRRWLLPPLAAAGLAGGYLNGLGAFRADAPEARAVYEVQDARAAMEWRRYPLARPFFREP